MSGAASERQWESRPLAAYAANVTLAPPAEAAFGDQPDPSSLARGVDDAPPLPEGVPHVVVQLGGARCLLPLAELRGVLTETPKLVRFPFVPPWMLGVFLYRAELLALVDPLPVLVGHARDEDATASASTILVGNGERSLGLRVDGVFEVVFVSDTADLYAASVPGRVSELIAARYVASIWSPDAWTAPLPILAVAPLLDDLLRLLAEEDRDG
jgi:chemotaxis signal transduction protein